MIAHLLTFAVIFFNPVYRKQKRLTTLVLLRNLMEKYICTINLVIASMTYSFDMLSEWQTNTGLKNAFKKHTHHV